VYCSVLQCVCALIYETCLMNVLQCVAVCRSVLQSVAVRCSVLQCVAVCVCVRISDLSHECVAVCCSVS